MFDENTYSKELIDSKKNLMKVRNKYFIRMTKGEEIKDFKPLINAEKRFAKEHDKYCDKYGFENQKITENWSKFWK